MKQFANNFAYNTSTLTQSPFIVRDVRFSQNKAHCVFLTDTTYFTVILLNSMDGTFVKAIKDGTLVMENGRSSVFMESSNDRLVIAFSLGGRGFIYRLSNFVLGTPSLSMSPWPAYTKVTEFTSILQGKQYTPSSSPGYIYYIAGSFASVAGVKNLLIAGYESGDNNALWFMANQEQSYSNMLGITKMTSLITPGNVEYVFGAGDSFFPITTNGLIMIRFVSM